MAGKVCVQSNMLTRRCLLDKRIVSSTTRAFLIQRCVAISGQDTRSAGLGSGKRTIRSYTAWPAARIAGQRRSLQTASPSTIKSCEYCAGIIFKSSQFAANSDSRGPMQEYDHRVANGRLRDDDHQRGGRHALCTRA